MTLSSTSIIKKLVLLFLVFAGLYYAKAFLMPLSIGVVLATLFLPLCRGLEHLKIPKGLAALICLLVLLAAIAGVVSLLGWQISELANDITLIREKVFQMGFFMQEYVYQHLGISADRQSQILKSESPSIRSIVQIAAGSFTYLLTNFILVMAYVFLLLYYRGHIRNFILKLSPESEREELGRVIQRAAHVSQQYLVGLTKMIVCLWIMYGIGFSILGVKNALFFAVLCGLLEIVPFVGNITGTFITVSVTAVQGGSVPLLLGIVSTYAFVQFIQGWVLEPLIVGPQVKINPFTTIIALVLGQLVWGLPGIFLAIPLVAMVKIACDHIDPLKPLGFLIGEIERPEGSPGFIKKIRRWFKK